MEYDAKQDPLFEAVRQLVLEMATPSVSHIQIEFRIGYGRAAAMLAALEGDVVTIKKQVMRKMLQGEPQEQKDSVIFASESTALKNQ